MNIQVHIERLVVDGSLGLDSRALEAAVIEGLSQALVQQPGLSLLQRGGNIAALTGPAIRFERSPAFWGQQFASAIHGSLANFAHGGDAPVKRGPP